MTEIPQPTIELTDIEKAAAAAADAVVRAITPRLDDIEWAISDHQSRLDEQKREIGLALRSGDLQPIASELFDMARKIALTEQRMTATEKGLGRIPEAPEPSAPVDLEPLTRQVADLKLTLANLQRTNP